MGTHTPGPWLVTRRRDGYAIAGAGVVLFGDESREADARLIASAPDLLGACEKALEALGEGPTRPHLTEAARVLAAAIAKAKEG